MSAVASKNINVEEGIPQWKKDLIARLKSQNKRSEERLWTDHHTPHHHTAQHIHHKGHLVCPSSSDSEYCKESESTGSSDSEDLHYGPGIVNRLRNKYLSLALRESNPRPTILRKATSLENLLDDDGDRDAAKNDGFIRRTSANESGNRYRSASRRQEMKRARSVEVISRANHDEDLVMTVSVTAKINNRQSLHEDMLKHTNEEKPVESDKPKSYVVPSKETNGEEISDKFSRRINRPKRIPPLLNEREKPPVDVVKHAKMIFEKKPETRTKKPHHTGDVAAKVDSFNDIIVKNNVASKVNNKPTIKTSKPVLTDKSKSNTHHHVRPVAKPVILSDEVIKPKSLELSSPKQEKKDFNNLPSPIPDVSRVDRRTQDGIDLRHNSKNSLCETPDLILTSSPIQKITSPTYGKQTTQDFIMEERNGSYGSHPEATNNFVSSCNPFSASHFNRQSSEHLGFKMISPITQKNITKNSATSVFNFLNSDVDQRHLPSVDKNSANFKDVLQDNFKTENIGSKTKLGLTAFEIEKNLKNVAKSEKKERGSKPPKSEVKDDFDSRKHSSRTETESVNIVASQVSKPRSDESAKSNGQEGPSWFEPEFKLNKVNSLVSVSPTRTDNNAKTQDYTVPDLVETEVIVNASSNKVKPNAKVVEKVDQSVVKPVQSVNGSVSAVSSAEDSRPITIIIPKKPKPKKEEATSAVFNFTTRTDVPDYISNDTSRVPSRPVIPKPDEPGIKLLPDALLSNYKEFQDMWEENELIRSLEARPPSPCDVTFINDNILIDGKSSLIQRSSKRVKLKISFVDDAEIYEYPSEVSLLVEETQFSTLGGGAQVGHNIPTLSGSTLATYTPKTTEDFQLGVTKTFQDIPPASPKPVSVHETGENHKDNVLLEEVEKPVLFSSGSTSDILF